MIGHLFKSAIAKISSSQSNDFLASQVSAWVIPHPFTGSVTGSGPICQIACVRHRSDLRVAFDGTFSPRADRSIIIMS
jgi:hypothetical protein